MSDPKKASRPRRRPGKNTFTTKSGTAIKLNRSLSERLRASRDARSRRRAAYLSSLPKNRFKRLLFRLHPRELYRYWFSRDGAIMALKLIGIGIVVCFVLVVGVFAYFRKDLPNIKDLSGKNLGGSMTYYDRKGETILWQDYDTAKRQAISTDKMAKAVRDATVAIEDKDFYEHGAFDIRGIVRAGINNVLNRGDGVQGGSTISQQLVKLERQWTAERTIGNKIKEVILAVEMEREYSKDDILTGYLNAAPYGPVQVGVQVAAQDYFGVSAKDLTIAQAAVLAAIPKAPSLYSPYGPRFDPELLVARQRYIIDQMANQKRITKAQADEAKAVDIIAQVKPQQPSLYTGIKAPYFVLAAKRELEIRYSEKTVKRGGWKIITTLDLELQDLAERKVSETMPTIRKQRGDSAAFVAMDNATGQVVALIGGADFNDPKFGKINFANSARVSPGSTFKPYDYAAFIESNNAGGGSVFYDDRTPARPDPGHLPGYPCTVRDRRPKDGGNCLHDYDFRFPGPITIRYALGGSRNIPAVKAMLSTVPNDTSQDRIASINKTITTAEAMMGNPQGYTCYDPGFTDILNAKASDERQCFASSAIGDGAYLYLDDHATGLSTFARGGQHIPHTYILEIVDAGDKTIDKFKQPAPKQVIKPETAFIISDILADPNASYMNSTRKFHNHKGWRFAIKTGTTNFALDGLMASWSTQYTAVTWVGITAHRDPTRAMTGAMENMTTPIIRGWMQGAHDRLGGKPVNFQRPSSVKSAPAFVITSKVGLNSVEPSPKDDIYPGWYNPPKSGGSNQTIDLVSNKLATACTPDLAKKSDSGGAANIFSVDVFTGTTPGGGGSGSTAADDIHNCNDAKPQVSLTAPPECKDASDCVFTVAITQGTYALSGGNYTVAPAGTLVLLINGQAVETVTIPSDVGSLWNHSFTYTPTTTGDADVEVRVVDSVLYSASQSQTVTFAEAP